MYMAPEVMRGEPYGVPADVFSLGIVLCVCFGFGFGFLSLFSSQPTPPQVSHEENTLSHSSLLPSLFSNKTSSYEIFAGILTSAVVVGPTFNPRAGEAYARKVADGFRRSLPDSLPPALKALIEACWAADPAARPTAAAVHEALVAIGEDAAAAEEGEGLSRAGTPVPRASFERSGSKSSAGGGGGGASAGSGSTLPGCMACTVM